MDTLLGQSFVECESAYRITISNIEPEMVVQFLPGHQVVVGHERGRLGPLPPESPNHPHAAEGLGGVGVNHLPRGANVSEQRPDATDPRPVRDPHRRHQQ